MTRILAIDDDEAGRRLIQAIFAPEGHEVLGAADARSGLDLAERERPDVVLLDLRLPDLDGMEVLDRLRAAEPARPVIMLTAHRDLKSAVRATQLGAFDYLTKPIDPDEILMVVRRALENRDLRAEIERLRQEVGVGGGLAAQMGPSRVIARVVDQVRAVAGSIFSVLVLGETGTGKELVAQAIHRQSDRRARPFIALDCGAIPETLLESELFGHERGAFTGAERRKEGRFQIAEGGTLFLDEVGNLPLTLQAKLLRVLESRQVQAVGATHTTPMDVRFIAATNDDLKVRAEGGRFRADLYFRLAQYSISLPPLRERVADVPYLAQRFLEEASVELRRPVRQFAPDAIEVLQRHPWPGNVRELRNVIRQAVLESHELILRRSLVARFLARPGPGGGEVARSVTGKTLKQAADEAAREAERQIIVETLRATHGNKTQAARELSTDFKTLHLKMKALGIRAKDFA